MGKAVQVSQIFFTSFCNPELMSAVGSDFINFGYLPLIGTVTKVHKPEEEA